nr:MAG TPA: holin [Caudoviricetes sp.]
METILNTILTPLPAWLALVLIVVGAVSLALGLIRLGYGAAVKGTVLDLIVRAEHEIQGTKRGAERKAWVVKMLRAALSTSKYGRLISWAITDETIGTVIQFFFDRARAALEKQ